LSDPAYGSTPARAARMEEIDAMVEAWTKGQSKEDVMAALTVAHVPCAPVRTAREGVEDPHLRERGAGVDRDPPRRGKTPVPTSPIRLHGSAPAAVARPAPLLGQDTDRVLSELLGLSAADIGALHAAGVIEPVSATPPPSRERTSR